MKNYNTICNGTIALLLIGLLSQVAIAEVYHQERFADDNRSHGVKVVSSENLRALKPSDFKQGSMNFVIFDSLANTYSYGNMMTNKAIKYETYSGNLVTVKRGFVDNDRYPTYLGDNTKNNLFLRKSNNWGLTWYPAVTVYNLKVLPYDEARYPSVDVFEFEGELAVAYNAPRVIEKASSWTGHIIGFWNPGYGSVSIAHSNEITGYPNLEWGIDSRVLADHIAGGDSFYQFVVGRISPRDNNNTIDANNIGWRKSIDLNSPVSSIPPQWASNKFRTVDPGLRSNSLVDLKKIDGNFYFSVFGGFAEYYSNKNSFGISKSVDLGETWTEFDILPWSVVADYVTNQGFNPDSSNFYYHNKGFTVLDNGDCVFATKITMWGNQPDVAESHIIEIIRDEQTKNWRINKIAGLNSGWITYSDVTNTAGQRTNPNDNEVDIARTVDGQHLLIKWVELIGYDEILETFDATDVFVSTRRVGTNTWSEKQNITNSNFIDRMTMLPDFIPDNLENVPLFKMVTTYTPAMSEAQIRNEQFFALKDQWLMVGHFNAFVGVKDENKIEKKKLAITNIAPNPLVSDNNTLNLTFYLPTESKVDFSIYDASGRLVNDLSNIDGQFEAGERMILIDMHNSKLPIGSYYINLVAGGNKVTKLFNVVRLF